MNGDGGFFLNPPSPFAIKYLPRKRKKRMTFLRNRDKMDIGYKGYGGSADEKQI